MRTLSAGTGESYLVYRQLCSCTSSGVCCPQQLLAGWLLPLLPAHAVPSSMRSRTTAVGALVGGMVSRRLRGFPVCCPFCELSWQSLLCMAATVCSLQQQLLHHSAIRLARPSLRPERHVRHLQL